MWQWQWSITCQKRTVWQEILNKGTPIKLEKFKNNSRREDFYQAWKSKVSQGMDAECVLGVGETNLKLTDIPTVK